MTDADLNAVSIHSESTELVTCVSEPAAVRYADVSESKSGGVNYTPKILADFVAEQIIKVAVGILGDRPLRVLDPAIGDGELILSLLNQLFSISDFNVTVHGFETDPVALSRAKQRITEQFPNVSLHLRAGSFLDVALGRRDNGEQGSLFEDSRLPSFDLIIANPPYVRTQIMGAAKSQALARKFKLIPIRSDCAIK